MICLDNIIFELQRVGGVSKYWANTIEQIDTRAEGVHYLEGTGARLNYFRRELVLRGEIRKDRGPASLRRIMNARASSSVFHSSYYRISTKAKRNVVTIHDFMNELYPKSWRDHALARMKRKSCLAADAIVTVSQRTRADLLQRYPEVDPGRVHVTYNGVGPEFYPDDQEVTALSPQIAMKRDGYFLHVGSRGYCKNFPWVVEFARAARASGLDCAVVLVGGSSLQDGELKLLHEAGIGLDHVQHLQAPTDEELRHLYSNCTALLIPSIYEGFGLPAAEAARCGALVIAARGSALEEVTGETDYAVDLSNHSEIDRILTLGFSGEAADRERSRIERHSRAFDWQLSARKLQDLYQELIAE